MKCIHEVIAVVVVVLFLVLAVGVARLGLRMIGKGSDNEALRDCSLPLAPPARCRRTPCLPQNPPALVRMMTSAT